VAELVALWWDEARRNDVLPLDNRVLDAIAHRNDRRRPRSLYRYFQGAAPVPEWVAVDLRNRSHVMSFTLDVPEGINPEGTLLALGCALGGWSLHVVGGRLRYVHNLQGQTLYEVVSGEDLGPGRSEVEFRFDKDQGAGGRGDLVQNGALVGSAVVDRFTPVAYNEVGIGLTCGYEWGPAVGADYLAPFPFNGTIVRAVVETIGPPVHDPVAEVAAILSAQ
jgi:arylsulfatase